MRIRNLLFVTGVCLQTVAFAGAGKVLEGFENDGRVRPTSAGIEEIRKHLEEIAYSDSTLMPDDVEHYEHLLSKIGAPNELLPSDWRAMIQIASKGWRFDKVRGYASWPIARQLLKESSLPTRVVDIPGADFLFWQLDFRTGELRKSREVLSSGNEMLVIFHPNCGPCRRMAADILSDAGLKSVMQKCSRWIGTVDASFSVKQYESWNITHPTFRSGFLREWSSLSVEPTYTTPTLVLLRSGKPIDRMVGWTREEGPLQLKSLLQRNGIYKSSNCGVDNVKRNTLTRS